MRILITSVLTIAIMILVWGCTHERAYFAITPTPPPTDSSTGAIDTTVCFQRDVLPIFVSHCAMSGCHDAGTAQEDYILDNYQHIVSRGIRPGNSANSKLYTICQSGSMPRYPAAPITGTELYYIKRWIDNGALNDTNCTVNCDTNSFTYAKAIKPIISTYCVGCHSTLSAPSSGGGTVLDTYSGISTVALTGRLAGDIQHLSGYNAMPKGGSKLPDCQITQILKWIQAGAQNN